MSDYQEERNMLYAIEQKWVARESWWHGFYAGLASGVTLVIAALLAVTTLGGCALEPDVAELETDGSRMTDVRWYARMYAEASEERAFECGRADAEGFADRREERICRFRGDCEAPERLPEGVMAECLRRVAALACDDPSFGPDYCEQFITFDCDEYTRQCKEGS